MTIPLKVLLLKVCAQLRPTAVNMAPSAFAAERRAAAPCCSPVLLQSGCPCDRQTDGHRAVAYSPAPYAMRALQINEILSDAVTDRQQYMYIAHSQTQNLTDR